ncbi:MAG: hypothetical protein M2R45_02749 [Verrucomicrobia subdivision 3 bacterium]|nr:hypothetical protein [Limisphaerales bacterium]MCS1414299.1 hypothetical protein [Limisphaerales bacterium]
MFPPPRSFQPQNCRSNDVTSRGGRLFGARTKTKAPGNQRVTDGRLIKDSDPIVNHVQSAVGIQTDFNIHEPIPRSNSIKPLRHNLRSAEAHNDPGEPRQSHFPP